MAVGDNLRGRGPTDRVRSVITTSFTGLAMGP